MMARILHLMAKSLGHNLKTLIYFEILYRLLGVLFLYPIVTRLFYLSIEYSPFVYITNSDFIPFLTSPLTLSILFLIMVLLIVYFLIEILCLQALYRYGIHEVSLTLKQLLRVGLEEIKSVLKGRAFYLIIPLIGFIYIIGFISVYGFISTIKLPILINELRSNELINRIFLVTTIIIFILFIHTMLLLPIFGLDPRKFSTIWKENMKVLKNRRIRTMVEFFSMNFVMNLIVYGLYFMILLFIGWLILNTRGVGYVIPTLFTLIYAIYAFIGFLSTLFYIPINIAYLNAVYYQKDQSVITPKGLKLDFLKPSPKTARWVTRLSILTVIVLVILNISTVYQIVGADRQPIELLNRPSVIAHRGASNYAPENTLIAMAYAIEQGADAVEIDVRMSSDGVLFLFHDTVVNRTTNLTNGAYIESLSFEQIQALDGGAWFHPMFAGERIPSLVEVLELIKGRVDLYLEIKGRTQGIETKVVELLTDYDMIDSTIIMSFNRNQLQTIKNLNPNLQTMMLIPVFFGSITEVLNLDYVDSYGLRFDMIKANPEYIEMIHKRGKRVYGWTINRRQDIQQAVSNDVDGIITDDPLLAIELAYEKITPTLLQDLIRQLFNQSEQRGE